MSCEYVHQLMSVPDEMIYTSKKEAIRQWVCTKFVPNPKKGKADKVPINPSNGRGASTTNPKTWASFLEASYFYIAWYGKGHSHRDRDDKILTGPIICLGFVLTPPFIGFDLDDCVDKGQILPWAQEIINDVDSYTEFSPSGTGIRIFVKGKLPFKGRRVGKFEVYQQGRFLTVTGNALPGKGAVSCV